MLHTSVWSIAETVGPKRSSLPTGRKLAPKEIAAVEALFRKQWLVKIDVDQKVALRAVELSRDFGLKPADAVHAATAIVHRLDVMHVWDRDFAAIDHLISVKQPARMSEENAQVPMAGQGFEPTRLGPHPDDFEKPSATPPMSGAPPDSTAIPTTPPPESPAESN